MKVAMWAVFLFVMGIVALVLINIFGNITTTNQQDYNLVRNTVEAAMYDSIDRASYRAGFYVCPKETKKDSEGRLVFDDKNQYNIVLLNGVNNQNINNCNYLVGEVKLNADVFVESFLRRYAQNINNNKSYRVTIQEVIEYPPKVSVKIETFSTYNSSDSRVETYNAGDFKIANQVDAIFEKVDNS